LGATASLEACSVGVLFPAEGQAEEFDVALVGTAAVTQCKKSYMRIYHILLHGISLVGEDLRFR